MTVAVHHGLCEVVGIMQNSIKTTMDPKDFRVNHRTILCRDGDFEVTATTEIINEDYDPATKTFTMQVGLYYPRQSTRTTVTLAVPARKDGKLVAIQPPDYVMTQQDFDAAMKGEVIKVPTHY